MEQDPERGRKSVLDHEHGHHASPSTGHSVGPGDSRGHAGHGDHTAQFRDKFWLSLLLSIPVVAFSQMFAELLGYNLPDSPGATWFSPVLGTFVFVYGGSPFLTGARSELRSRRPGMMLLIAMAITVAFAASWATTLSIGGFDLDFWWERTVTSGTADVDESMVTGESRPVTRTEGDRVVAGTVATDNALLVLVTAVGDGTMHVDQDFTDAARSGAAITRPENAALRLGPTTTTRAPTTATSDRWRLTWD